ncbi:hypothetical protein LIER_33725 [Lithospermum erythrorhizon]|uniref:Aminotransferase-like plant mobile domain-containing protein n=1 Tax=Lithospermum erythrorhizon TaxID=34254 RepID=A0AAV3S1F5_LITER
MRSKDDELSIVDWISFWCKRPRKYTAPPARKEPKTKHFNQTDNPTRELPRASPFTSKDGDTFASLRTPIHFAEETYLATFLSCWLCLFVLPSKSPGTIRPSVFKMVYFMTKGNEVRLAIPILLNIYGGLNIIAKSKTPSDVKANFPFHYVCGWMAFYFNTHYPVAHDLKGRMVKYNGEVGAKFYAPEWIDKRIQTGVVTWSSNKLQPEEPYSFVDYEKVQILMCLIS